MGHKLFLIITCHRRNTCFQQNLSLHDFLRKIVALFCLHHAPPMHKCSRMVPENRVYSFVLLVLVLVVFCTCFVLCCLLFTSQLVRSRTRVHQKGRPIRKFKVCLKSIECVQT